MKSVADMTPEEHEAHKARCKAYRKRTIERWRQYDRDQRGPGGWGREKKLENDRARHARNKETYKSKRKAYFDARKGLKRQYDIEYRDRNAAELLDKQKRYYSANKSGYYARVMKRNAQKLKACPKWANHFFIEEAYDLALRRSAATGIKWDVDHIVPLQSPLVCGLHSHDNIRVIPAKINRSKGNRHWPDMP